MGFVRRTSAGQKYIETKAGKKFYVKERPKTQPKRIGSKYVIKAPKKHG